LVWKSLICNNFVNFFIIRLPNFTLNPILKIFYHFYKVKLTNNKWDNRNGTLELIESIISTYNKIIFKRNKIKLDLLNFHEKFNKSIQCSLLKYNLQLYLLRNLLYRILSKCLTQANIRELVKMEILKAPERTFSDFIDLYHDLKKELNTLSL
jgi:hypothetical protein